MTVMQTGDLVPTTQQAVPTGTDLPTLIRVSEMLAQSDLVPAAYRGKPANVLLASMAGQSFGWDPTMSMRSFTVIQGQPTMKPEIMMALVRRAGHSVTGETSATGATVTGTRADTGDTMTVKFTEADARQAGLLGKGAWKTYPEAMFWARAVSKLCRMLFQDVTLGCAYTAEELGSSQPAAQPAGVDPSTAKRALVDAAGGNTDVAKNVWIEFGSPTLSVDVATFDQMMAAAREGAAAVADADVIEAEVVESDAPDAEAVQS